MAETNSPKKPSAAWWAELVRCPDCGIAPGTAARCAGCGRSIERRGNLLHWPAEVAVTKPSGGWRRRLGALIDPLRSPVLPFRYITWYRTEQYYARTLTSRALADKWAAHYLGGLAIPDRAVVLDYGCGRGRNVGILSQLGYRVVGQELQSQPWWHRLKASGFQTVADSERLPWCDEAFDLVVEVGVIHYLSERAVAAHAVEVARVLKPGGWWLLLEANATGYGAAHLQRQIGRLHTLAQVREWCAAAGLDEFDLTYEGFYARSWPLLVNYLRKQCSPRRLDLADFDSRLAAMTPPERRGLWLMRLRKPKSLEQT